MRSVPEDLDAWIRDNRPLIFHVVKRRDHGLLSIDDAYAEALYGIFRASRIIGPGRSSWVTHAYQCMIFAVSGGARLVRHRQRLDRESVAELAGRYRERSEIEGRRRFLGDDVQESLDPDDQERLRKAIAGLPKRMRVILCSRFGIAGHPLKSVDELCGIYGISKARLFQIRLEAIRRIERRFSLEARKAN